MRLRRCVALRYGEILPVSAKSSGDRGERVGFPIQGTIGGRPAVFLSLGVLAEVLSRPCLSTSTIIMLKVSFRSEVRPQGLVHRVL